MAVALEGTGGLQTGTTTLTITGFAGTIGNYAIWWYFHKGTTEPGDFAPAVGVASPKTLAVVQSTLGFLKIRGGFITSNGLNNTSVTGLTSSSCGSLSVFSGVDARSPLLHSDYNGDIWKSNSPLESAASWQIPRANVGNFIAASGDMSIGIVAYDNDASTAWPTNGFFYNNGSDVTSTMTEIADGMTTGGTDCGGAWAYVTGLTGTYQGFTVTPTEGSAGTADSAMIMFGLRADVGTLAASSTLVDDFDDNSIDTTKWKATTTSPNVTPVETGGQLTFPNAGKSALISKNYYDPNSIMVKVVAIPSNNGLALRIGNLEGEAIDTNAFVGMTVWSSALGQMYVYGPSFAVLTTWTWTETERAAEPYLRMRVTSTDVIWESGNGVSSWTTRWTATRASMPTIDWDLLRIWLVGTNQITPNGAFDNFNTTGSTGTPIGKELQTIWNIKAAVGQSLQLKWNTIAAIAKTLQLIWLVLTPVTKSLQEIWNVRTFVGASRQFIWNVIAAIGKNNQLVWNVRANTGKNNQLVWNVLTPVTKSLQEIWHVRATVGKNNQLVWNVGALVTLNLQLIWNVLINGTTAVGQTLQLIWNVRAPVGSPLQLIWNVRAVLGKEYAYLWLVWAPVGKNNQLVWNILSTIGKSDQFIWNVRSPVGKPLQFIWNLRAPLGKEYAYLWNVRVTVGKTEQFIWNVVAAVGKSGQFIWNVLANGLTAGNNLGLVWNVRKIVKDLGTDILGPDGWNNRFTTDVNGWLNSVNSNNSITWDSGELKATRLLTNGFVTAISDNFATPRIGPVIFRFKCRATDPTQPMYFAVYDLNNRASELTNFTATNVQQTFEFYFEWFQGTAIQRIEFGNNSTFSPNESFWIDDVEILPLDTTDLITFWNVKTAVGKNNQLVWNILTSVNKALQFIWNVRQALGKEYPYIWNVRANVGKSVQFIWSLASAVGKSVQYIWNTLSNTLTAGNNLQLLWNVRGATGKNNQLVWNVNTKTTKSLVLFWNLFTSTGKSTGFVWNTRAVATKALTLQWNVLFTFHWDDDIEPSRFWKQKVTYDFLDEYNTTFDYTIDPWLVYPGDAAAGVSAGWSDGALRISTTSSAGFVEAYLPIEPSQPIAFPFVYRFRARASLSTTAFIQASEGTPDISFGGWVPFTVTTNWQDFELTPGAIRPTFNLLWVGFNDFEAAGSWIEFDDIRIVYLGETWGDDIESGSSWTNIVPATTSWS